VLTGATSGETATVVEVTTREGSWGSDDVKGTIHVTGTSDDFTGKEQVNGNVGGSNLFTLECNATRRYGRAWAESDMVEFRGKWYCQPHFEWAWNKQLIADEPVYITEGSERE